MTRAPAAHATRARGFNQSPPYEDVDLFASDRPLQDAVAANGGGREAAALSAFGRHWGSAEMFELARLANENPPKLKAFDPKGFRRDVIEFHPAYHQFMAESIARRPARLDLARGWRRALPRPPRSRAPRASTWRRRSRTDTCVRSP